MNVYRAATVIKRLIKHQPRTAQEVLDKCELPLLYIGGGSFRDAYFVVGTDLVIKIPRWLANKKRYEKNIQHAKDEYFIWRRMRTSRRKYNAFKKYLPDLLYFNSNTGVIVVRKYEKARYTKANNQLIIELEKAITKIMDTDEADIHYGNLGVDKDGSVKIIDMGLFIAGNV